MDERDIGIFKFIAAGTDNIFTKFLFFTGVILPRYVMGEAVRFFDFYRIEMTNLISLLESPDSLMYRARVLIGSWFF
jgi:hypothetical protein